MESRKCIECGEKLVELQAEIDEVKRDVYLHPLNPLKNCKYRVDGCKVTVSVEDAFMLQKFQQLQTEDNSNVIS